MNICLNLIYFNLILRLIISYSILILIYSLYNYCVDPFIFFNILNFKSNIVDVDYKMTISYITNSHFDTYTLDDLDKILDSTKGRNYRDYNSLENKVGLHFIWTQYGGKQTYKDFLVKWSDYKNINFKTNISTYIRFKILLYLMEIIKRKHLVI